MADVKIRVIGEDQASDDLKKIDANLKNIDKSAQRQKLNWQTIGTAVAAGTAAFYAASRAAKAAYDVIKEGAAIELATYKFENLSAAIGTTSGILKSDLRLATQGMMSDAESMALAGDLMSLGLAKTHDEAVRLTSVAAQLGMNMNQLVLTLTNKTTMRFDALGIAVDGFDEKVKRLEASGLSADEAFKFAFMEQAEDAIERTGGVAETTAGQIMMMEASWANLTDTMKAGAAEAVNPALTAINILNKALDEGVISWFDYGAEVSAAIISQDAAASVTERWAERIQYLNTLTKYANIEARDWDGTQRQLNDTISYSGDIANSYADRARNAAQANAEAGATAALVARQQGSLNDELLITGKAYSDISTNIYSATQALQDQLDFLAGGGGALLELQQAAEDALDEGNFEGAQLALNKAVEGATDLDLELGKITTEEAQAQLEKLGYGPEEAKKKVEEMQASIFAMVAGNYTVFIDVVERRSGSNPVTGTKTYEWTPDADEYASGTAGWQRVPGAPGQPYPAILHGGEMMNIVPQGQSAGGGNTVNWYGDAVFTTAGEAMAFIANMQSQASRNARSAMAGAGYVGQ